MMPEISWHSFVLRQNLKRIEVIEDDESEIMEAVSRMSNRYDFIVTRWELEAKSKLLVYFF